MADESPSQHSFPSHYWILIIAGFLITRGIFLLFRHHASGDLKLYHEAYRIATGPGGLQELFGKGDFPYPPLAALLIIIPGFITDLFTTVRPRVYFTAYRTWMVICDLGILLLLPRLLRLVCPNIPPTNIIKLCFFYLVLPLMISVVAYERLDLGLAFMITLSLYLIWSGHIHIGAITLGLGITLKIVPILLVPPLIAYIWSLNPNRKWKQTALFVGNVTAGIALGIAPFILLYGKSVLSFSTYQSARGIQLESVLSSLVLVFYYFGLPVRTVWEARAMSVVFPAWRYLLVIWTMIGIVVLTCSAYLCLKNAWDNKRFSIKASVRWMTLFMVLGIAISKVFSLQFLIWLFPLILVLSGADRNPRRTVVLFGTVMFLTMLMCLQIYEHITALNPAAIFLLQVRNTVFIAFAIHLFQMTVPASRQNPNPAEMKNKPD